VFIILCFLVVLLPIAEIYLLIESGRLIGALPTIGLVIATGVAGSWLMRQQGFHLLGRAQAELAAGKLPTGILADGLLVFAGGLLLLTPGFCTDLCGFTMLLPGIRYFWRRALMTWFARQLASGRITMLRR
jgi:UPF0716 protein FxsA